MSGDRLLIDDHRSACLCDVGGRDYAAVVAVDIDGAAYLLLAHRGSLGDESVRFDVTCPEAPHDQAGPLPLEYVRRIAAAQRTHRCGRPTATGGRCRIRVTRPGEPCHKHRRGQASR